MTSSTRDSFFERHIFFPLLTALAIEMDTWSDAEIRCKPCHAPNPNLYPALRATLSLMERQWGKSHLRNAWSSSQSDSPRPLQDKDRAGAVWAEPMSFRGWGLPEATGTWWAEQNKPQMRFRGTKLCHNFLKDQPTYQWACCQRVRPVLSDPCVKDADGARTHPNTKPFWPKAGVGLV